MQISKESTTLDQDEYRHALELLENERESMQLSRGQVRAYKLLNFAVYGWALLLALWLLLAFITSIPGMLRWKQLLEVVGLVSFGLSWLMMVLAAAVLLFNLPLIGTLVRKDRVLKRLGLQDYFESEITKRSKGIRWWDKILIFVASVFLIIAVGIGTYSLVTGRVTEEVAGLIGVVVLAALGVLLISFQMLRRGRQRLQIINEVVDLQAQFKAYEPEGSQSDHVTIPTGTLDKLAGLERQQISRERARTILWSSEHGQNLPWFVQKSREAKKAQEDIPAEERLLIDDVLDQLTTNPHPDGASEVVSGQFVWKPEGSPMELRFSVDEASRNIRLLQLVTTKSSMDKA